MKLIKIIVFLAITYTSVAFAESLQINCPNFQTAKAIIQNDIKPYGSVKIADKQWTQSPGWSDIKTLDWNHVNVLFDNKSSSVTVLCVASTDDNIFIQTDFAIPSGFTCRIDGKIIKPGFLDPYGIWEGWVKTQANPFSCN
ncbi:MAG: hypothetical protein KIT27_09985 [Legionellales bacterium]|nr:hypothetical protein [Legionellales bacterium]